MQGSSQSRFVKGLSEIMSSTKYSYSCLRPNIASTRYLTNMILHDAKYIVIDIERVQLYFSVWQSLVKIMSQYSKSIHSVIPWMYALAVFLQEVRPWALTCRIEGCMLPWNKPCDYIFISNNTICAFVTPNDYPDCLKTTHIAINS